MVSKKNEENTVMRREKEKEVVMLVFFKFAWPGFEPRESYET